MTNLRDLGTIIFTAASPRPHRRVPRFILQAHAGSGRDVMTGTAINCLGPNVRRQAALGRSSVIASGTSAAGAAERQDVNSRAVEHSETRVPRCSPRCDTHLIAMHAGPLAPEGHLIIAQRFIAGTKVSEIPPRVP
jgi:hypothetical protein